MAQKLVNLLALLSIAVVGCSYGVQPANALAAHGANHLNRADHHALAAKKQRRADASKSKLCRKRPSGLSSIAQATSSAVHSSSSSSSSKVESTSIEVKTTAAASTKTAAPATTPKPETTTTEKATTKTSSSAAQATTKASSGGGVSSNNGHGKVGLAWPNGNDPSLKNFVTGQVSWYVVFRLHPSRSHP
jgi:hypothetical protein